MTTPLLLYKLSPIDSTLLAIEVHYFCWKNRGGLFGPCPLFEKKILKSAIKFPTVYGDGKNIS